MKNLSLASLAVACAISLAACGTVPGLADAGAMKSGTQVSAEQMAAVIDNKSTQADVVSLIGQPNRKVQVGKQTVWYYDFNQIGQALIGRNINETSVFEFDGKGVLVSHYKTGGQPGTSSNALLRAAGQ